MTLSERIRNEKGYKRARAQFEQALRTAGVEFGATSFDWYDNSVELYDVPPSHRLSEAVQRLIANEGFAIAYVNHTDKWETHYYFQHHEIPIAGWRVSYGHKRGDDGPVWVEERPGLWPDEMFVSGEVIVVSEGRHHKGNDHPEPPAMTNLDAVQDKEER